MAPEAITNGYGGMYLPADGSTDPDLANREERPEVINNPSPEDVAILEQLYGTRKKMRIIMLGAGMRYVPLETCNSVAGVLRLPSFPRHVSVLTT